MQRRQFCLLISSVILSAISAVRPAAAQEAAPSTSQPVYRLYTSFGCSRTFRKQANFDNLADACEAAQRFRKSHKLVWVATGNERDAFGLHPSMRDSLSLEGCSVYVRQCRLGMQLRKKTKTAQEAEALADKLGKSRTTVEVVYHLRDLDPGR